MTCRFALVVALGVATIAPAKSQAQSATDLAECILSHSSEAEAALMTDFLVAALTGQSQDASLDPLYKLGDASASLAVSHCGQDVAGLEGDAFHAAFEIYAEALSQQVLAASMTRLGF